MELPSTKDRIFVLALIFCFGMKNALLKLLPALSLRTRINRLPMESPFLSSRFLVVG